MDKRLTEKELNSAIRKCHWRVPVNGQRNLHLCGGACNICEKLIEEGRCDTLQRLFKDYNEPSSMEIRFDKEDSNDS